MSQPRSIRKRAASVRRQVHAYMRAVCSVYNILPSDNAKIVGQHILPTKTYSAEGVNMCSVS
jgi:hypothetical protein